MSKLLGFARFLLPGFDYGFGWILPALGGLLIGIVIWRIRVSTQK